MFGQTLVLNSEAQTKVSAYFTQVYGWMAAALGISGAIAWYTADSGLLIKMMTTTPALFYAALIAELVLVVVLSALLQRMSIPVAMLMFIAYSALTGFTLSTIFLVYTAASIATTFLLAASIFGVMALYGLFTNRNLGAWGGFLIMSLFGMILASLVNLFLKSPMIDWMMTYAGIVIFSGLAAYDHQKLKAMCLMSQGESLGKLAIFGALSLYLDFINLFLSLLRAFGKRR
jgi:uncharacterized protein